MKKLFKFKNLETRTKKLLAIVFCMFGAPPLIYFGMRFRAITVADGYLQKGFGALAADTLHPYRETLTSSTKNCSMLIGAYYLSHSAEKLEWASQSCISHEIHTPDSYMGLAASLQFTGREEEALKFLTQVSPKFDKVGDLDFQIAEIYRKNRKEDLATKYYVSATEKSQQNASMNMKALEFLVANRKWDNARVIAERLKNEKTESPDVKLIIARAFKNAGDEASAKTAVLQAKDLMGKMASEERAIVERTFSDELSLIQPMPATADGRQLASPPTPNMVPVPGFPMKK